VRGQSFAVTWSLRTLISTGRDLSRHSVLLPYLQSATSADLYRAMSINGNTRERLQLVVDESRLEHMSRPYDPPLVDVRTLLEMLALADVQPDALWLVRHGTPVVPALLDTYAAINKEAERSDGMFPRYAAVVRIISTDGTIVYELLMSDALSHLANDLGDAVSLGKAFFKAFDLEDEISLEMVFQADLRDVITTVGGVRR